MSTNMLDMKMTSVNNNDVICSVCKFRS